MPKGLWDDAVSATKRDLRLTSPEAVLRSNRSACIELPPKSRVSVAGVAGFVVVLLVAGLLLLVAAVVLVGVIWTGRLGPWREAWVWPFGAFAAGAAWVALAMAQEKWCFGRIAPITAREFELLPREPVGIEPAETYRKFKILPDDLGILYHDAASGRLLVMSTTHCACICGTGLVSIRKGEGGVGGSGVQLDVRFASKTLSLVVSARDDLFDADDPLASYDPKAYFLRRLQDTLDGPQAPVCGYAGDDDDDGYDEDDDEAR